MIYAPEGFPAFAAFPTESVGLSRGLTYHLLGGRPPCEGIA